MLDDVTITADAIALELEELRRPLTGYCYRLLAGASDTEDAVQETMLRATQHLDRFDPRRGTLRTWTYRIATNVCLDMLRRSRRRAVATDLGPAAEAGAPLGAALPPERWVEPMPDARIIAASDPADVVVERESVRLAFVAALQHLAPRQRAVLVLREVLQLSAEETAEVLDTSTAAVNSALQRARQTLARHRPLPAHSLDPDDADRRALLDRYVDAFERHDVDLLLTVLREDVTSAMPPLVWWVQGRATHGLLFGQGGCEGAHLLPTSINGAPGFGQYRPDDAGILRPFALMGVEVRGGAVSHVTTFLGTAGRFGEFGLPAVLPPAGARPRPMSCRGPVRSSR